MRRSVPVHGEHRDDGSVSRIVALDHIIMGIVTPSGGGITDSSPSEHFSFAFPEIMYDPRRPASLRGAYASSRTLRRDAVDAAAMHDGHCWRGR
jgi:hypothetical protein